MVDRLKIEQAEERHQLRKRIAEMTAESERLKQAIADANADRDRWYASSFRANSRASDLEAEIARLTKLLSGRDDFIVNQGLWGDFVASLPATNTVEDHETGNVRGKPEGQQEPVAWLTNLGWIDSPRYTVSFDGDKSRCDNFPVYTRPSEQAVTEAREKARFPRTYASYS